VGQAAIGCIRQTTAGKCCPMMQWDWHIHSAHGNEGSATSGGPPVVALALLLLPRGLPGFEPWRAFSASVRSIGLSSSELVTELDSSMQLLRPLLVAHIEQRYPLTAK
jgi:hypothetical protein